MSYIYKITNSINDKIYIGYTSQSLKTRFAHHKYSALNIPPEKNQSYLYNAMRKYGVEKFKIEPLLEFNEEEYDWKELEKEYIKKFNTLRPNGYNLLSSGDMPPVHYGNENHKTKIKDEDMPLLIEMLRDTNNSYQQISKHFDISVSELYSINQGHFRRQKGIEYPIRKYSKDELYALQVMNLLKTDRTLSNQKIADLIPNYFRANEIASINCEKKYAYLHDGDFPIRKILVPDNYEEKQKIGRKGFRLFNLKRLSSN